MLSKPLLERSGQGRGPAGVTRPLSRLGHRCGPDHSEGVESRRLGRPSTHEGKDLASARSVWVVPRCPDSAVAVDQARGPVTHRDTGARARPGGSGGATPPAEPRPGPHQVTGIPSRRTRSFRGKSAPACSPGAKPPSSPSCAG